MSSPLPSSWREDLQAAVPWVDSARAVWLANLNEAFPWRTVVGDIRLADGQQVVLKYQTYDELMQREWAAARLLAEPGAPAAAPACLGGDEARKVLVFERLTGPTLIAALDGERAWDAWIEATRAVANLHRWAADRSSRWLELCPLDEASSRLAVYDLPFEDLVAPFQREGEVDGRLAAAAAAARHAVADPGRWLCFTHSDLQTRHFFCTPAGARVVDWERAGLRHRLYDLACLIAKPINHGRRLPRWAQDADVAEYARVCALDLEEVRCGLAPVLAYELLIGVAETHSGEMGPAEARACLEALLPLAAQDARLAAVREAAAGLIDLLPEEELPFCAGLDASSDA